MRIAVVGKGLSLTPEIREHVDRRLGFSLSRFAPQIETVRVHLTDENGPRGGRDKLCLIVVEIGRVREVVVRQRAESLSQAVSAAAVRAGRAVARQLKRIRQRPGDSPRRMAIAMRAAPRFKTRRRHRPLERSGRSGRWR